MNYTRRELIEARIARYGAAAFDESKIKRDDDGQFASKGESGQSSGSTAKKPEAARKTTNGLEYYPNEYAELKKGDADLADAIYQDALASWSDSDKFQLTPQLARRFGVTMAKLKTIFPTDSYDFDVDTNKTYIKLKKPNALQKIIGKE